MTVDPRWLELLKASGWQSAALGAAAGLFYLTARWGWFPSLPTWVIPAAFLAFLIFGLLCVASILSALARSSLPQTITDRFARRKWNWKLRALPKDARDLLAVLEEDGIITFYYAPGIQSVGMLRDKGLLQIVLSSADGRGWAKYELADEYKDACYKHRPAIRSALRGSCPPAMDVIRSQMRQAQTQANRARYPF